MASIRVFGSVYLIGGRSLAIQLLYTFLIPVIALLTVGIWAKLTSNVGGIDNYDRVFCASVVCAVISALFVVWQ